MTCRFVRNTCVLLVAFSAVVLAQDPAASQFASLSTFGADTINRANLNVHLSIPVVSKAGRQLPFSYALLYDSTFWQVQNNAWVPKTTWGNSWGWRSGTENSIGYITYIVGQGTSCSNTATVYSAWTYVDPTGRSHYLADDRGVDFVASPACLPDYPTQGTYTAHDGSGYTITVNNTPAVISLYDIAGNKIVAPAFALIPPSYTPPPTTGGPGSITDPNGNTISTNGSTFTDTVGSQVLTISGSNPVQYAYTGPQQTSQSLKVNYAPLAIATNFGCTGVTEYPTTPWRRRFLRDSRKPLGV
jgi:hypothetical protein